MGILFFIFLLHGFWRPTLSLMSVPDVAVFIRDFIEASEMQLPQYTTIICGGEKPFFKAMVSASPKRFFLLLSPQQFNVSAWRIPDDPHGFIVDMNCEHSEEILRQASELNLFRIPYSWLLLGREKMSTEDSETALAVPTNYLYGLDNLYPRIDSLVVIAEKAESLEVPGIVMTEIYKIRPHLEPNIVDYGEWTLDQGITLRSNKVKSMRRLDFNGTTITGSLVATQPGTMELLDSIKFKYQDSASRITYSILKDMCYLINAKLHIIETNAWGILTDGKWSGMIGDLLAEKADVGGCPLYMSAKRMEVVDYLLGLPYTRTAFIATTPPLSYSHNLFTLPFGDSVWGCSVGLVFITSLLLYLTTRYENDIEGLQRTEKDTLFANWSDIAMLNLGVICQQGCDAEPKGPSGRMVTIILYLAIMFLYVSYSASIVALLQSSDTSIKTMKDLLDSPLQCGAEDTPYHREWFSISTDPVRKALYKKKMAPKGDESANYMSLHEGIKRVRNGLYAFHVEVSNGYMVIQQTFTESEKCALQELPSFIQVPEPWIPLQKKSPYAETFKVGMKWVREVGMESRFNRLLFTRKPPCSQPGTNFVSVGLMDSYNLFVILTYGIVSSLVLVVIERLVMIRLKKRLKDVQGPWMKKIIGKEMILQN